MKEIKEGEPVIPPTGSIKPYADNNDGWREWAIPLPVENHCVNVNKIMGLEEPCDAPGNSAWNTLTTSRTGKPSEA